MLETTLPRCGGMVTQGSLVSIFTQPDGKTVKPVHPAALPLQ